jgi:hypothetical protein
LTGEPDTLSFTNAFNISSNCTTKVLLQATEEGYASWSPNDEVNITIPVDWSGHVGAPVIGGTLMQLFAPAADQPPQHCAMMTLVKGAPLFIAGSSAEANEDTWRGAVGQLQFLKPNKMQAFL